MFWNDHPNSFKKLIRKLSHKHNKPSDPNMNPDDDDDLLKVWIRIPHFGHRRENLINSCLRKIRRYPKRRVKCIVTYNTKKISYFVCNKDKIPELSKSNVVYQISCPGCNETYTSKNNHCL